MAIRIRAYEAADEPAVAALVTAAFADDGRVAVLAGALRERPDAGAALLAIDDADRVVGVVQLSVGWVDTREQLVDVLVLSPLAVAPDRQSTGIGAVLLSAAHDEARRLGSPLLFLEGDPGYYCSRGWRAAGGLGFLAPSVRIPAPAFLVQALEGYEPTTMRGALVYNDTFWTYDCVGLRGGRLDRWASPDAGSGP